MGENEEYRRADESILNIPELKKFKQDLYQPTLNIIKTSKTLKDNLDIKIAEYFYASNTAFRQDESEQFLKMVKELRPCYKPPYRRDFSTQILDIVYENAHSWLKEKHGRMPQIPNDTRWNSQMACNDTYIENYHIYREIVKENDNEFNNDIIRKIDDMNIYKNALDLNIQLDIVGNTLDKRQTIKEKFKEAIEPFHLLALLLDPMQFEEGENLNTEMKDTGLNWLEEQYADYLPYYLSFRIKDTELYPRAMFATSVIQNLSAYK
ncbi:hypothetical protein CBL_10039 [Carabus blaptoides fortunei]